MAEPLVALTTIGSAEQGRLLARELVESRLAACVTCLPGLHSVYRWKGSIAEESEMLLLIKTTAERAAELQTRLRSIHPYEVPEYLAFLPCQASKSYRAWLGESTGPIQEGE